VLAAVLACTSCGTDAAEVVPQAAEVVPQAAEVVPQAAEVVPQAAEVSPQPAGPVVQPAPRTDANSLTAHADLLAKARQGGIDLYFEGDSITRRWGATDYPELLDNWNENFFGWNAANFGWGGDTTANILWRLEGGELDRVDPKVIVLLAGTNDIPARQFEDGDGVDQRLSEDIVLGIRAILREFTVRAPEASVILMGVFPRNDNIGVMPTINAVNVALSNLADGESVRFLDINDRLAGPDGRLFEGMMEDGLHPGVGGYQVWADALEPILTELLGPRLDTDHAPPPTGNPAARPPVPNAE
jgi:lysophospholipase L1-like esterase